MKEKELEKELELPEDIIEATGIWPRDLVLVSIPKMGKSIILGEFTKTHNAIVLDLEKGGFEYISARKMSTYSTEDMDKLGSFQNYIKFRNLLLKNRNKYDYLIIDGLTDLDDLSELGGTFAFMDSVTGSSWNRVKGSDGKAQKGGPKIPYGDPDWKSVITMGEGFGYQHTRNWFMQQIDIFKQISPYRIYAAHVADKYIKDNGKEEVVGSEIFVTGKLKTILAAKVTALGKLVADGNLRYINFDVLNDSIIAGSRATYLKGKILISKMDESGELITYWDNIYK
jgi:hypothetical protein